MNPFNDLKALIVGELEGLAREGALPQGLDYARVAVEPPRDPDHGDLATNAARASSRSLRRIWFFFDSQHTSTASRHHSALRRLPRIGAPSTIANTGFVCAAGRVWQGSWERDAIDETFRLGDSEGNDAVVPPA